ncbi:hypothetical protein PV04_07643 [Phialophora macrospora]|uniref:Histone chaperone domain-containing protein n=1 Tax=Phialophora macrospora TaxID=1851006 RepID=A0A0D2FBI5_9EURO|nr:hypothetical protein PV04_07643 [Phialophora macrospora]
MCADSLFFYTQTAYLDSSKVVQLYYLSRSLLPQFTMSAPNDEYRPSGEGVEGAHTTDTTQNDYKSRTGQSQIPVVGDEARIEDPIDERTADSDAQLARDDTEAINEDNIISDRTRGAGKSGMYREPGDEEGLPGPDDGTSAIRDQ